MARRRKPDDAVMLDALTREHPGVPFPSSDHVTFRPSRDAAPFWGQVPSRDQIRDWRYELIAKKVQAERDRMITGASTCRCDKNAIEHIAAGLKVHVRTVWNALDAVTLSSCATK
jgi:hypothetical protein